jgi:hypothetical protein
MHEFALALGFDADESRGRRISVGPSVRVRTKNLREVTGLLTARFIFSLPRICQLSLLLDDRCQSCRWNYRCTSEQIGSSIPCR